jgi:hypothetical protein
MSVKDTMSCIPQLQSIPLRSLKRLKNAYKDVCSNGDLIVNEILDRLIKKEDVSDISEVEFYGGHILDTFKSGDFQIII